MNISTQGTRVLMLKIAAIVVVIATLWVFYEIILKGPLVTRPSEIDVIVKSSIPGAETKKGWNGVADVNFYLKWDDKSCNARDGCRYYKIRLNSSTQEEILGYWNSGFYGPMDVYDVSIDYGDDGTYDETFVLDTRPRYMLLELDEEKTWYGEVPLLIGEVNPPPVGFLTIEESEMEITVSGAREVVFTYNLSCECISKVNDNYHGYTGGSETRKTQNGIEIYESTIRNTTEWRPFIEQRGIRELYVVGDEDRRFYPNQIWAEHEYIFESVGPSKIRIEKTDYQGYDIEYSRKVNP